MAEYEELRIRAFKTGTGRYLMFANGPETAAAVVTFKRPVEEYWRELAELFDEEFRNATPPGGVTTTERARILGRELFQTLLPEPILGCLRTSLQLAQGEGRSLRLCFDVLAELMDLPFEILCSPPEDYLGELSLQPALSIVRSLPGQPRNPLRLPGPDDERQAISLVLVVSSPKGSPPLQAEREIDAIEAALPPILKAMDPPPLQGLGSPRWGKGRATLANLQNLLLTQASPCIVVLIAHGGYDRKQKENVILLESEDGSPEPIPGRILRGALTQAPGLRLAILNLCLGSRSSPGEPFSGLAQSLIAGGVPAVVAMQMEVSNKAASVFSPALLQAICRNRTLDEAVSAGRLAAHNREIRIEWANPVLFLHQDCGQGWLFKVQETRRAGHLLPDPLREANLALQRFRNDPNLGDIPAAVSLLKQRRDWKQVSLMALAGVEGAPRNPLYRRLAQEADVELRIGELDKGCNALGLEDDVARADKHFAALRPVLPSEVIQVLSEETEQANEASQRYREALESESREAWTGAVEHYDAILRLRPTGYRDVRQRLKNAQLELTLATTYGEAEAALAAKQWEQALLHYGAILAKRPAGYRDAALGAAYAEGRIAEKRGDWAGARQIYRTLLEKIRKEKRKYRDTKEREAYARGRATEEADDWQGAARAYKSIKALEGLEDIKERFPYAQARAAEQAGRWTEAADGFGALDRGYRDVRQREAYARGRSADEKEAWQAVLDAFGALPLSDDYRDGDVGRRRGFARAKLTEKAESWAGVIEALSDVPPDFHDGEAAILRNYAEGRLAEAREDWARAATAYDLVPADDRDARTRALYAHGRHAAEEDRWADAVKTFAALPASYREDIPPRRLYAEGRSVEEQGDWTAAASAYRQLTTEFLDSSQRLPYACVREAAQKENWEEVSAAAAPLPESYRDIDLLLAYAQGRLAEEREDWSAATDLYGRCNGYADAHERQTYARGRLHEADGDWSQALAAWEPLPSAHRDVQNRRERLSKLLKTIPWADSLAGAGLAVDPCAGGLGLLPYAALKGAGIHLNSPAAAIKEASFVLMERGAMTPEARLAWDHLRSPEGRLRVDAFLYHLEDAAGLRCSLQQLAPGPHAQTLAALCAALPADAPVFFLLDHRREDAIAAWETLLAQDPAWVAAAHGLALAHYFRARELEASGAYEQAESTWKLAIAGWAVVLSDDAYWDGWRRARAERYQQPVTSADVARLRSELGQDLLDHLTDCGDRSAAEGHSEREERYQELTLALEVELEGARVLKEVGGLPLGETGDRRLVCGPLYLHHSNLGFRLGQRVAEIEAAAGEEGEQEDILTALDAVLSAGELAWETPRVSPSALFRLRCIFSELNRSLLLLNRHQPELALRALPRRIYEARLATLTEACDAPVHAESARGDHVAVCPVCLDFEHSNPAYLHLPHRSARLLQDAIELAIRSYLALAQAALTAGSNDLAEAFQNWQEAIKVSRNAGSQVRTKRAIVRVVLGRARALAQERGRRRGERVTAAIEMVEQAQALIGSADEGQLAALAAELLTDRGVWYGYGCHEYEDTDYEKAAQDLRCALKLTPDSLHARDNLSRALIFQAASLQGEPGGRGPLKLLAEAIAVLHEGLRRTAGHRQLLEMLRKGLDELEECILFDLSTDELAKRIGKADIPRPDSESSAEEAQRLAAIAARRRAEGDETGELIALLAAVRRDAGDDGIRQSLLEAVQRRAGLDR
jgi:hypothetical protein